MYPVQLEEAVRAVPGVGDEHEIVLSTDAAGLDVMTVRVEHADATVAARVAHEIRTRCEVRVEGEALARGHAAENGVRGQRVRDLGRA